MKRVCIHQPDFAPYLGFFHRLLFTDLFIIFDDVQFLRRGWHHRDKIKSKKGAQWLTLSVKKGDYHQKINEVVLYDDDGKWKNNHLNLIKANYAATPYFSAYYPKIEAIYRKPLARMMDLNMEFIHFFLDIFNIHIKVIFASDLNVEGRSNVRLIHLLNAVNCRYYLSGIGARAYLDESMFADAGIQVAWQEFKHPVYPQLHGDFLPNLSCLDVLFNCGLKAAKILRSC